MLYIVLPHPNFVVLIKWPDKRPNPLRGGVILRHHRTQRCEMSGLMIVGVAFEQHFRDLHVLLQHSDKSSQRYASAGRLMLGVENDWVWLSF